MSDDLVKRLRDRRVCSLAQNSCRNDWACEQAADRIEELEAKLKTMIKPQVAESMVRVAEPMLSDALAAADKRIEELEKACKEWADVSQSNYQRAKAAEAKLAKAVEAFTDLEQDCEADYPPSHGAMKYYIQRALAELKGEQP